jgi:hypothetical protein
MELLHRFHPSKNSPENSLMRILRDGYLRSARESGQYGMVRKDEPGAREIFLGVNISRWPYADMHLDWRLLAENKFDLHLGWGGPVYNPYDATEYISRGSKNDAFTNTSLYDFKEMIDPHLRVNHTPVYRIPAFDGAEMSERELYDLVALYRTQNDIRPEMFPAGLTEITVKRRISLHKYLRAVHADSFSIPELNEVVVMYLNIRVYAARQLSTGMMQYTMNSICSFYG